MSTVKLRPAAGRFIARQEEAGELKTEGGIIVPGHLMPEFGDVMKAYTVISVGEALPDADYAMPEKESQVLMPHYAGQEIILNGKDYRLCTPDLVWAHIDGYVPQGDNPENHGKV